MLNTRTGLVAALVTSALLSPIFSASAQADEFSALAVWELEIIGFNAGLDVKFADSADIDDPILEGSGTAGIEAGVEDQLQDNILVGSASADGAAGARGIAEGGARLDATVEIANTTDGLLAFDVSFTYFLDTAVFGDLAELDDATAVAEVTIDGGELSEGFSEFADLAAGELEASAADSLLLGASLAPGETLELDLSATVFGSASAVPVPPAVLLLASAVGGLLAFGRRRRAAS